jgi:hypothetical protein
MQEEVLRTPVCPSVYPLLGLLAGLFAWAPSPVAWASAEEEGGYEVGVVQGVTPEHCAATLAEAFKAQGKDPESDPAIQRAIQSACSTGAREYVIVSPKEEKEPVFTIDATGSASLGNVTTGTLTGSASYQQTWDRQEIEVVATGTWFFDEDGSSYHSFLVSTLGEYFLSEHWSVFAFVGVGRDTKKALAFTANEFVGAMYNVLGHDHPHQIKLSGAVGHRYEETLDGALAFEANDHGFSNNNAVLSWRAKYEGKLFGDAIELMAALWFQHILYSPPNGVDGHRVLDFTDFRLVLQLNLKVNFAEFGNGARAYISLGGTYEYFARPLTSSPYDLLLQGGLGISF